MTQLLTVLRSDKLFHLFIAPDVIRLQTVHALVCAAIEYGSIYRSFGRTSTLCFSETFVFAYQTIRCHRQDHCRVHLKYQNSSFSYRFLLPVVPKQGLRFRTACKSHINCFCLSCPALQALSDEIRLLGLTAIRRHILILCVFRAGR